MRLGGNGSTCTTMLGIRTLPRISLGTFPCLRRLLAPVAALMFGDRTTGISGLAPLPRMRLLHPCLACLVWFPLPIGLSLWTTGLSGRGEISVRLVMSGAGLGLFPSPSRLLGSVGFVRLPVLAVVGLHLPA